MLRYSNNIIFFERNQLIISLEMRLSIQVGMRLKTCLQAKDWDTLAREWATWLAC